MFVLCAVNQGWSTSALLMNCSVAAFSFSLCPLQALRADACRARPKEKDRIQGLARGQLLMAFRLMEASSSLWPPDRNATPVGGTEHSSNSVSVDLILLCLKSSRSSRGLTHLWRLGELCGVGRWRLPWQPLLGCTWWGSCVQGWPCWVLGGCLPGTHGGLTWPCILQPGPVTQTMFNREANLRKILCLTHFLLFYVTYLCTCSQQDKRNPPSQWCTGSVSGHDHRQARSLALWWAQCHAGRQKNDCQSLRGIKFQRSRDKLLHYRALTCWQILE